MCTLAVLAGIWLFNHLGGRRRDESQKSTVPLTCKLGSFHVAADGLAGSIAVIVPL